MKNNYDKTAGFYDLLAKMMFGNTLMLAQKSVLPYIPKQAKILIVGGGTGAILEEITKLHPSGMDIVYIEISEKMLVKSAQRQFGNNKVQFVHAAIEDYESITPFDVIITSFLFDNFKQDKATLVFKKLDKLLILDGKWLFTDFNVEKSSNAFWKKWLLNSMYLFFKIFSNVEANQLPDTALLFHNARYKQIFQQSFYGKFIHSAVYQKA